MSRTYVLSMFVRIIRHTFSQSSSVSFCSNIQRVSFLITFSAVFLVIRHFTSLLCCGVRFTSHQSASCVCVLAHTHSPHRSIKLAPQVSVWMKADPFRRLKAIWSAHTSARFVVLSTSKCKAWCHTSRTTALFLRPGPTAPPPTRKLRTHQQCL